MYMSGIGWFDGRVVDGVLELPLGAADGGLLGLLGVAAEPVIAGVIAIGEAAAPVCMAAGLDDGFVADAAAAGMPGAADPAAPAACGPVGAASLPQPTTALNVTNAQARICARCLRVRMAFLSSESASVTPDFTVYNTSELAESASAAEKCPKARTPRRANGAALHAVSHLLACLLRLLPCSGIARRSISSLGSAA
jgi:hypothetical protein